MNIGSQRINTRSALKGTRFCPTYSLTLSGSKRFLRSSSLACLLFFLRAPESIGQQVREARNPLPLCGRSGQAAIKPGIDNQVFSYQVGERPQVAYCVSTSEWLCEVPEFSGQCEWSKRVGD